MDQKWSQIQVNKEPPEASEIVNLDGFTGKILSRKDTCDWEKADMLAAALERFLALRPRAFGQPENVPRPKASAVVAETSRESAEIEKSRLITPVLPPLVSRGKRKESDEPPGTKRRAVPVEDLLTDGEEETVSRGLKEPTLPPLVSREKRKASGDQSHSKKRPVPDEAPPLRGQKRKAERRVGEVTKKRPLLLTLKRNSDGTYEQRAKRSKPTKSLKRKIDEIEEESILRKKQQTGGQFNWIYVY